MSAEPVVETTSGKVRGIRVEAGISAFLGIRYGADTSGAARFRAPSPPVRWAGICDAFRFGPTCPQSPCAIPAGDPHSIAGLDVPVNEDCLVLNAWTPEPSRAKRRPVMVWLHPGGFSVGSASHPVTDGARLAGFGDVVLVSLNHRLEVFGFLLPSGEEDGCANVGMCDIVLALRWVRENIEAFGGDPSNVTVFGQSGGGRKICVLMGMPSATGLYHRAIVQSGAHPRCIPRERAERFTAGLLRHFGSPAGGLSALRAVPADILHREVVAFCRTAGDRAAADAASWTLSPVVDAEVLPDHPWGGTAPEASRGVPLVIGSTKDEAALHLARWPDAGRLSEKDLRGRCRIAFGDAADTIVDAYRAIRPDATPWDLLVTIASEDRRMLSIGIAEQKTRQEPAGAFMYLFSWESDRGLYRSAHTMDVPFVFRTWDRSPIVGTRPDRAALADAVSGAWVAFARTGDPSTEHAPWPTYGESGRATLIADVPARLAADPMGAERRVWAERPAGMPWEPGSFVGMLTRLDVP